MSVRRALCPAALALAAALVPVSRGSAQDYFPSPAFGVRGGYDTDAKEALVGGLFTVPLDGRLELSFIVDFLPARGFDEYQANADALLRLTTSGNLYAGAGFALLQGGRDANVSEVDPTGEFGYNIFAGYEFLRASELTLHPFVEARWTSAGDNSRTRLAVGLSYLLEKGGYGARRTVPWMPRLAPRR